MPQKTVFKDILAILAVFALIFMGYYTYYLYNKTQHYIERDRETVEVGMDTDLSATVDSLEKALVERSQLNFRARTDPLDLTRVIIYVPPEYMVDKEEEQKREEELLRRKKELLLKATIIGEKGNSAVFYYQGENHRLHEGESINNKKVVKIEDGSVVVEENGRQKVYSTKQKKGINNEL